MNSTIICAVYDDLADWEIGYVLTELRTGRFTGRPFEIRTVALTASPVTTMGGLRVLPDLALAELDPSRGELLILPGSTLWDDNGGEAYIEAAAQFLQAGVPVAAICGATYGLARAGLLDERAHTSSAAEYLRASGYRGAAHYRDERAVVDGDLVTAGPQSPVQFACATLSRLGLAPKEVLQAYEAVFDRGDPSGYPVLMQAAAAA